MATKQIDPPKHQVDEAQLPVAEEAASPAAAPKIDADSPPIQAPLPASAPTSVAQSDLAERLRAEYAEIAALTAQADRLGVSLDAADAMRRGISAADLRRSVLDTLAARAEATSVIAAAPSTPVVGDSPIVRRAKERAAAARA